jgi:hypothetical protein
VGLTTGSRLVRLLDVRAMRLLDIMMIGVLDVRGDGECVAAKMSSVQLG